MGTDLVKYNRDARSAAIFFILKLAAVSLALTLAAAALQYLYHSCAADKSGAAQTAAGNSEPFYGGGLRVVVDAGHGGRDGGAISVTGTPEKILNLEISRTLAELLRAVGVEAIETRTEDTAVGGDAPKGSRKMADLKGRLEIAQANPGALFISIHQNKFSISRYKGLQVWYSKNDAASMALAEYIRATVAALLQPDNKRQTKAADSEIFLLDRITSPAVTVECGFISNPEEAAALETKEYRDALATVLLGSIVGYNNGAGK